MESGRRDLQVSGNGSSQLFEMKLLLFKARLGMFVLQFQVMLFAPWWMEGRLCAPQEEELLGSSLPNLSVSQLPLLLWCEMNMTTTEHAKHHHTTSHLTPLC